MPARSFRAALPLLVVAVVACVSLEPADYARASDPVTVEPSDTQNAPDGETASVVAQTFGHDVVDDSQTTSNEQVFAQPDGNFRLETSNEPVRLLRDSTWVPIDLTLRPTSDGGVAPEASPTSVRFSGGGSDAEVGAILGADGGWSTQSWTAGTLPVPVLSQDTATYQEVYPGVDLKMTATLSGFSQVLVIKTPDAADNPALRTVRLRLGADDPQDGAPAAGGMDLTSETGSGVHVGVATWWDSTAPDASHEGPGGAGAEHSLPTTMSTAQIALNTTPVTARDDLTYPVFVDPSYSWTGGISGGTAYTFVDKSFPTTGYWNGKHPDKYQHVGYVDAAHGGPNTGRAFWRMATNGVAGKHIISAEFNTFEVWASSCTPRPVELWSTGGISTATTWDAQPAWSSRLSTANFAYGWSPDGVGGASSCTTGGKAAGFAATPAVVKAATSKASYITLGLRVPASPDYENDWLSWKKFRAAATLVVIYNSYPNVPTNPRTSANTPCISGASRPAVGALPTLYVTAADPDGGNVAVQFEWWKTGSTKTGQASTAGRASGTTSFAATIPSTAFVDGANVSWRARTWDGTDWSAFSGWCEFRLDRTRPAPPRVSSAPDQFPDYTYFENQGIEPAPVKTAGDAGYVTVDPGGSADVTGYYISVNGRSAVRNAPNLSGSGLGVTVTPGLPVSWIDVYAVDAANNRSDTVRYSFPLKPASTLIGQWKVAGVADLDDGYWHSASAPPQLLDATEDLTITSGSHGGTTPNPGNGGPRAAIDEDTNRAAVRTDGTNDYLTSAGPAVDTSQSYTIVATVKPDDAARGTYQTFAAQGGSSDSAFYLQFDPAGNIRFVMTSADSTTRTSVVASAGTADVLDPDKCGVARSTTPGDGFYDPQAWRTIVAVYDKPDNQMQLWIDGCSKPVSQVTGPATAWNANGPLLIGTARQSGKPSAANMFGGGISDVIVYDDAATDVDIARQLEA